MLLSALTGCGWCLDGKYSSEDSFQALMANVPTHLYISGFDEKHDEQFIFKKLRRTCRVIDISRSSDSELKNSNPCIFFGAEFMVPIHLVHVTFVYFLNRKSLSFRYSNIQPRLVSKYDSGQFCKIFKYPHVVIYNFFFFAQMIMV